CIGVRKESKLRRQEILEGESAQGNRKFLRIEIFFAFVTRTVGSDGALQPEVEKDIGDPELPVEARAVSEIEKRVFVEHACSNEVREIGLRIERMTGLEQSLVIQDVLRRCD